MAAGDRPADRRALAVTLGLTSLTLVLLAIVLLVVGRDVRLQESEGAWAGRLVWTIACVSTPLLGLILTLRVPRNRYAWLWAGLGLALSTLNLVDAYVWPALAGRLPGAGPVGLLGDYAFLAFLAMVPLVLLWLPDGRAPGPRWRWLERAIVGAVVLGAGTAWARVGRVGTAPIENPFAVEGAFGAAAEVATGVALGVLFGCIVVAAASVAVRYRGGSALERQQLRWLGLGALVLVLSTFVDAPGAWDLVFDTIAISALPAAVAVAVLRYHLYDLSRLVSRTLSYAIVVAVLAAVYYGAVLGLGSLARTVAGGVGGDVVVAASTLLAAAVARPVRARVVSAVDRRYDRSRYDAHASVERFGLRLRDEIDVEAVTSELIAAARATVHPADVHVWHPGRTGPPTVTAATGRS